MSYQLPEDQDYIEVHDAYDAYDAQEDWDDGAGQSSRHSSTPRQTRSGKRRASKPIITTTSPSSGSDTETEHPNMSSRISKHSPSSSISRKDKSSSPSSSSSSSKKKTDDWTEVTEPDERRRIQNRIAQRKFREKAREQKDRAQRDAQNQQHAGSAYHIPSPSDFTLDDGGDLSGLPWGGLNMRHVVSRGHASASAGHHTHSSSHHSNSSVVGMHTPAPIDPALYAHHQMSAYGYGGMVVDGSAVAAAGEVYHGGYDSPYVAGYYDYDFDASGDGSHGM